MSQSEVDVQLLGDLIRRRRKSDELSLREAADQIGISAPTLQRVEAGQLPNTTGLLRIAHWLGVSLDDIRSKKVATNVGTVAQIEVHLRADPHLDDQAAEAIAEAVQKLYEAYARQPRRK
jgi:transcriptional regulator with XRE-family HTH domain